MNQNIEENSFDGPSFMGKVLIAGGFIAACFPFGVFFGILPYCIGLIFLWSSKMTRKHKVLWSVIPLILWVPIFLFLLSKEAFYPYY